MNINLHISTHTLDGKIKLNDKYYDSYHTEETKTQHQHLWKHLISSIPDPLLSDLPTIKMFAKLHGVGLLDEVGRF